MSELKVKKELGNSLKRIASLLSGAHELTHTGCPLKHSWKLLLNSLQKEIDDLIKINGNDKPAD